MIRYNLDFDQNLVRSYCLLIIDLSNFEVNWMLRSTLKELEFAINSVMDYKENSFIDFAFCYLKDGSTKRIEWNNNEEPKYSFEDSLQKLISERIFSDGYLNGYSISLKLNDTEIAILMHSCKKGKENENI